MTENTIEISLTNDLQEIAAVAAQVDDFCTVRSLGPEVAYAVNLSVDELLNHTIINGYRDDNVHRIEIIVHLESDIIAVVIIDDSEVFVASKASEFNLGEDLDTGSQGGLELFLVHQMMDSVQHRRKAGCNIFTLIKKVA